MRESETVIAASVVNYFEEEANKTALEALLYELDIEKPQENRKTAVYLPERRLLLPEAYSILQIAVN